MEDEQVPEADVIDNALAALIDEIIGEEGDIEEFDAASDVVLDVIEELAEQDQIQDPPDTDATDEEKQKWIDEYLPVVKDALQKALHDGFTSEGENE